MTEEPQRLTARAFTIDWRGAETVAIQTANQFLVQIDGVGEKPDQVILAVGQVTPPPVIGTPEQKHAQLEHVTSVNVITLARYSLTPARVGELIALLQQVQHAFETGAVPAGEGMPA